jgi:hypothetical protein
MLKIILTLIIEYLFSLLSVAIGWDVFLVRVFAVPVLGFKHLCLLTFALDFLSTPITITRYVSNEKK